MGENKVCPLQNKKCQSCNYELCKKIIEYLNESNYDNSTVFINPCYTDAIIGITDQGNLIYSFDKMVDSLSKEDNITQLEAIEFIEYNTIRSIPYMNGNKPIISYELMI